MKLLDNSTYASNPGAIRLSHAKLCVLRPDLYGVQGVFASLQVFFKKGFSQKLYLEEQLMGGDSRAAVVISTQPLLIAAYTDELDCVAVLRFPSSFVTQYKLAEGTRLLTVNTYSRRSNYDEDLIVAPETRSSWTGFHPVIAEFLSDDMGQVENRKRAIDESEWQRAYLLGKEYVLRHPNVARDGRPVYAVTPARRA